jgi:hypothetical protein
MNRREACIVLTAGLAGCAYGERQVSGREPQSEDLRQELVLVYNLTYLEGEPNLRARASFFHDDRSVQLRPPGGIALNGLAFQGESPAPGEYSYVGAFPFAKNGYEFQLIRANGIRLRHEFQLLPLQLVAAPEMSPRSGVPAFKLLNGPLRPNERLLLEVVTPTSRHDILGKSTDGEVFTFASPRVEGLRTGRYHAIAYRNVRIPLRDINPASKSGWCGVTYQVQLVVHVP